MSRQYEKYRIYRACLYLYPKQHRQVYGQQMVQTLDDILSDQDTNFGRFAVWLKVSVELPINAIEENLSSLGEISVNKLTKITAKQYTYAAGGLLIIGSLVLLGVSSIMQRSQIKSLNQYIDTVSQNQLATSGGNYNAVSIVPSEDSVYLPLAKLKLTATDTNESLVYTYAPAHRVPGLKKLFNAELDISTHDLSMNNFTSAQFDCSQVVYADFVTPSYPVNPMWKSDGSTKLADGRTMNVYYAPSISGCTQAWAMSNIDSKSIADSLKQAISY
jgi:hypothetical protein